ncbi:phosphatase PAP2 family protein [Pararcticibacter amylolyticus]|uniref:Phosphoesterase n=1 Tax=Pararcticibacter amylolyticus TaxID=2173175 RepID=A0A2U2PLX4_9SPHI|nr:phosphatase PAP2 family protein [Pararcticibacter amylolyticus]PWG82401.1 phosphoesterase [Pararcticibacter amylolyticus]
MKRLLVVLLLLSSISKAQTSDSLTTGMQNPDLFSTEENEAKKDIRMGHIVSYIPPAVCVGYGFMALNNNVLRRVDRNVYNDMRDDHPNFRTDIDDYMQYSPLVAAYALTFSGIKGKNNLMDQAALSFLSLGIAKGSVWFFKDKVRQLRPNQESYNSFPSGHTATAFAAAEIMNQEFGDRSAWYGIAAYSAATATGILRVYNNAHWFSNIIAGAGFGILSVKATYALYPHLKNLLQKNRNVALTPYYSAYGRGLSLTATF